MVHTLQFTDIQYRVQLKARKKDVPTHLQVLHGISGACVSGRLFALMGPSGAGKTSLLDILAGVPTMGKASGRVLMDGVDVGPESRAGGNGAAGASTRGRTCYVQQRDVHMPSATVRESLLTSALLLLPMAMPRAEKESRVDALLHKLGLEKCANTMIGDETFGIKGISGGERRRLSVGMELVKEPTTLFLDEPTTGLDSEMAVGVMRVLQSLARDEGKMVIATIHQPNTDITKTFDDLMLLAAGRVVYAGPWDNAVPYFSSEGYPCPMYANPTDYFMSLASNAQLVPQLAATFAAASKTGAMATLPMARPGSESDVELGAGDSNLVETTPASAAWEGAPAPVWYQVYVLMLRFFRAWMRTPIMAGAEMAQYVLLGLFTGLLYLNQSNLLPDAAYDRLSTIFLVLTLLAFTPSYTALVVWDVERKLLLREAGSGTYKRSSFFLAKSLSTAPVEIVQVILFCLIVYFMVNFQRTAEKFLIFLLVNLLFTLTAETVGFICAIITPDSKMGVAALTLIMVVILSFSGFLVRNVPVYFQWIARISFFSYATDALGQNEFYGLYLVAPDGTQVPGEPFIPAAMSTGLSLGANVGVLAAMLVGTRLIAWAGLEWAAWAKFL